MNANKNKQDAQQIIENFGGIRPMAKKLNVAVTTVQGWKKRNTIPDNRMPQIKKAAQEHNISMTGGAPTRTSTPHTGAPKDAARNDNSKPQNKQRARGTSSHNPYAKGNVNYTEPTGLSGRTTFIALIILIVFMVAGLMTIAPKVKVVSEQADRITQLERELKTVQKEQSVLSNVVPSDLRNTLRKIEKTAQTATTKAQKVATTAREAVAVMNSGSVEERIGLIEDQIGNYIEEKNSINLMGVWQNVQALRGSKEGASKLGETSKDLLSWVNRLQSNEVTIEEALPIIVQESPLIGEVFGDVEKENLKAAAMLLAMSQLRDSLSRDNASFEQDLALLQKLVGDENPALSASIEKLSPHAQEGVLTSAGLSQEFRGLAGDVVVASLKGEDVSISEKAKSRFGEVLVIKKDGEQLTGTETQIAVAEAQRLIDGGDIQGTIQVLQNLDGDAAAVLSPFLKEAKLTLLASQIQELLGQNIQSKIRISALTSSHGIDSLKSFNIKDIGIESVIDNIKEAVPLGGQVYEDPETGFKIYRKGSLPR